MRDRYLLYIDVLGFSDLVKGSKAKIVDLYEVIASLHVHNHPSFRVIIFSDTILVYNIESGDVRRDRTYFVMYLCEFAQDLQHRLTAKDIFFRAVLVKGQFTHYELNGIPCFFGEALIRAYRMEKEIGAIGLFMQNDVVKDSDIFPTRKFNDQCSFVYITQSLTRVERGEVGDFPIKAWIIEETDEIYHFTPEVMYLKRLRYFAMSHPILKVRQKYKAALNLFKRQYPRTLKFLEAHDFRLKDCSPSAGWSKVVAQWPENFRWAVKKRKEY